VVKITAGMVTAIGGSDGAGIGGGKDGTGGTIKIEGEANVTAKGGENGVGGVFRVA
jgi:hypothetical protein